VWGAAGHSALAKLRVCRLIHRGWASGGAVAEERSCSCSSSSSASRGERANFLAEGLQQE
jgi:hypothetical protein